MNVIAHGIDCATPLTVDHVKTLHSAGVTVVGRYLGLKSRNWLKGLSQAEVATIHDGGLRIISVWEGQSTHADYFTHDQGKQDAEAAVSDAIWLGQPFGTPIYFTVDFDAQDANLPAINDYFKGANEGIGQYRVGGYGSYRVVEYLMSHSLIDYAFQTVAWSGGKVSQKAHVYQRQCDVTQYGLNVDIDDIYAESGAWPVPPVVEPKTKPVAERPKNRVVIQHPTVKFGDHGDVIKTLQHKLGILADGVFGPLTLLAVKKLQKEHCLTVDGVVGPATWAVIDEVGK